MGSELWQATVYDFNWFTNNIVVPSDRLAIGVLSLPGDIMTELGVSPGDQQALALMTMQPEFMMASLPEVPFLMRQAAAETNTVTVGRWMSQAEADAITSTGRVQAPLNGTGQVYVSYPPNPGSFTPPSSSTTFLQFDVPPSSLRVTNPAEGWHVIDGPGSLMDRLGATLCGEDRCRNLSRYAGLQGGHAGRSSSRQRTLHRKGESIGLSNHRYWP